MSVRKLPAMLTIPPKAAANGPKVSSFDKSPSLDPEFNSAKNQESFEY